MSPSLKQVLLLSVALSPLPSSLAFAQDDASELPGITVTAPSPIARHRARPRHATPAHAAAARAATPGERPRIVVNAAPQQGVLPIVTDRFATVTVVPSEAIRRSGAATLGDLLTGKPGITGSGFAPGASSRPIVRGLDANRVGIVENGVGSNGASDLGEDHFVPIDPLSTNQVEVIRGPAALRWGSTPIGGVVSASNNRIPETMPCAPMLATQTYGYNVEAPPQLASPAGCATLETRAALSSVDQGREGAVLLDAAGGNVAIHADAFARRTGDYAIPGGTQKNTATDSHGESVGASYVFTGGFVGAAITRNDSLYRIPGTEGEELGTRIDARQTKFTAKGEYRPDAAAIDAIRFWLGATDYKHNELGLADAADPGSDGVRQTFTNKEQEGRLEVQLAPFDLRFAALTTAFGAQASHQDLTAPSPDNPGSPLNGLWDPNSNGKLAGYVFNELKFSDSTRAQLAARIEHVSLDGAMPRVIPGVFDLNTDPSAIGPAVQHGLSFTPKSGGIGLIQNLPWDLVASLTGQYTERAPKPAELFSRGAHDATATFDIGNPDLGIETATSIEVGLRRARGPFRFELTGYATRFNGFIYRRLTGNTCDATACIAGPGLELNQAIYSQRDANFRGAELQFQYDALPLWNGTFGIEGQYDIVRATFADGSYVPRIPPQRVGGGVYYRDANWFARVNLLHAFAQNNVSGVETPTEGYNRLRAELSYTAKLPKTDWWGAQQFTFGIVGDNLLNADIRNAVSYNKDQVLMPGLGVRIFANVKY
ncbi:MAG: TonB-dependent receptor [Xanthobacteraceae bacterium]|nr:TonB-dependent receptor [Xanthobacteraceae bacterium]